MTMWKAGLLMVALLCRARTSATAQVTAAEVIPQAASLPTQGHSIAVSAPELSLRDAFVTAVAAEAAKAVALGRIPVVEFSVPWCTRCQKFDNSFEDVRMRDALAGAYLIRINTDEWNDDFLRTLGFATDSTNLVLFPVDLKGRPVGPTLTAGAWVTDRPERMAPPLAQFVQAQARRATPPLTMSPQGQAIPVVTLSKQGIFLSAIQRHLNRAAALGRTPFIELSTSGCAPCARFAEVITQVMNGGGPPHAGDAFMGTYLIRIGYEWGDTLLHAIGLRPPYVFPSFFTVDTLGKVTGHFNGFPGDDAEDWRQFQQFMNDHHRDPGDTAVVLTLERIGQMEHFWAALKIQNKDRHTHLDTLLQQNRTQIVMHDAQLDAALGNGPRETWDVLDVMKLNYPESDVAVSLQRAHLSLQDYQNLRTSLLYALFLYTHPVVAKQVPAGTKWSSNLQFVTQYDTFCQYMKSAADRLHIL